MEQKITYIANICDIAWLPKEKFTIDANGKKVKQDRVKHTGNHRHKLFCRCGGTVEFHLTDRKVPVTIEQYNNGGRYCVDIHKEKERNETGIYGYETIPNEFEPVTCPDCKCTYYNFNQVERLSSSRTTGTNIKSVRCRVFDNEQRISLCCYATKLVVNHSTKKLICQDVKSSISFNKKWRFATKIARRKLGGYKLRRFGLQDIVKHISETLNQFPPIQIERVKNGVVSYETVNIEIMSALDEFCSRLLTFINPKDGKKIQDMLKEQFFNKTGRIIKLHAENEEGGRVAILKLQYDFLIEYKIPIILAVAIYPPLATLLFTKGTEFVLAMLSSYVIPPTAVIRKEMPTSPIEIVKAFVRLKLLNDSKLHRRHHNSLDSISDGLSYYARGHNYNDKIPPNIVKGDKRLDFINISKKSFREMKEPKSFEIFLTLALQTRLSIEDTVLFINKYGIDMFNKILSMIPLNTFSDIKEYTGSTVTNNREILHLLSLTYDSLTKPAVIMSNGRLQTVQVTAYVDTLRILYLMKRSSRDLLETQNFFDVVQLHDKLVEEYKLVKDEFLEAEIQRRMKQFKFMDCTIGNTSFRLLSSILELQNESVEMHHCVGTYAERVAKGRFIIFQVKNELNSSRATMSIRFQENGAVEFDQLKAYTNAKASHSIQKDSLMMLKNNNIMVPEYSRMLGGDLENSATMESMLFEKAYGDPNGGRDNIFLPF